MLVLIMVIGMLPTTVFAADYRYEDCGDGTHTNGVIQRSHSFENGVCTGCGATEPNTPAEPETPEDQGCEHEWEIDAAEYPTCNDGGYIKFRCVICREEQMDTLSATGHKYFYYSYDGEQHEAKCKDCGYSELIAHSDVEAGACKDCGYAPDSSTSGETGKPEESEKPGGYLYEDCGDGRTHTNGVIQRTHTFENGVCTGCGAKEEPKATEPEESKKPGDYLYEDCGDGKTHTNGVIQRTHTFENGVCTGCGAKEEPKATEPEEPKKPGDYLYEDCGDGRTHTNGVIQRTHTFENGVCTGCGAKEEPKAEKPVDPETCDHKWELDRFVNPTCTEDGFDVYLCKTCGSEKREKFCEPLGHKLFYSNNLPFDEKSHMTYCERNCGYTGPEAHVWGEWQETVAPTCTEAGKQTRTCEVCGASETVEILTEGHDWKIITVEPNCVDNGHILRLCKICGETEDELLPATGEHQWGAWEVVNGTYTRKCKNCDATFSEDDHEWGAWIMTTAPTCTKAGEQTQTCKTCPATQTMEIPATDHSIQTDKDADGHTIKCENPNCDLYVSGSHRYGPGEVTKGAEGDEVTQICLDCGYERTTVIPVDTSAKHQGHRTREQSSMYTPATCDSFGSKMFVCFTCNSEYYFEVIEPLGHVWSETYENQGDGTHAQKCEREGCGATIVENHELSGWVRTVAPQVGVEGREERACAKCGYTVSRPVAALRRNTSSSASADTVIDDGDIPMAGGIDDEEFELTEDEIPLAGLMTRAEFVNYLWEFEGMPTSWPTTFLDVPEDHPYYTAVGWAQANRIAFGVDKEGHFLPDNMVTVGHARLFLERYAAFKGISLPELITLIGWDDAILTNAGEVLNEFPGPRPDKDADDEAA